METELCENLPIMNEIRDGENIGTMLGTVKWFHDRLGYGFITICRGSDKGKDIFVHHSGIRPASSHYRTLYKGEYVMFDTQTSTSRRVNPRICGDSSLSNVQATNVTGVDGGCLMCDIIPTRRYYM